MNGQSLADAGMSLAQDHANAQIPDWTGQVMACLESWLAGHTGMFAFEDFRAWVELNRPDLIPPSHQAWGVISRIAMRWNLIKPIGYRPAQSARTHGHPVRVFVRAV